MGRGHSARAYFVGEGRDFALRIFAPTEATGRSYRASVTPL